MPTRILVVSDTHIPERASEIPPSMLKLIESLEYDVVVHAGDLCGEEVLEWLKGLGGELYVVSGNMDYLPLPTHAKFQADDIVVGVVHGHQVYPRGDVVKLTGVAKRLGAQLLISGHTHYPFIRVYGGVLHVNPGSLTGVWGGGGGSMKPSLAYVAVNGCRVHVEVFEERSGRVVKIAEEDYELC